MNDDTTNQDKNNWQALWQAFDKIIHCDEEHQEKLIKQITQSNKAIEQQLRELIKAHYSPSKLLDSQPQWLSDFRQSFQPPQYIRGYKIQQKLGTGGIGEVYLASKIDDGFERKVAIKFATTGRFSEHVLNSFNTELKTLLTLNHPNIERLYDGGITQDNIPFLIVEYIDGTHVDNYCDNNKLNLKARLKLFQKICLAVDAVHRSLIIHRDIKAGNIMITHEGEPKLLDFGLAKIIGQKKLNDNVTYSSMMMTIAYASPEQVNGSAITTASDVYSLGVLLYYLLTGKMPYEIDRNDLSCAIKTINNYTPQAASQNIACSSIIQQCEPRLEKKLKGDLELIVAKSLSKNFKERYQTASQFAEDIQCYLENRPVIAKKETFLYRIHKFIKRNKVSVGFAAISFIALISLVVILAVQAKNLKHSMIEIKQQQDRVQQVTSFLKDIFILTDPLSTDASLLNVKDLLDASSKKLDSQFNQQAQTKAMLYHTLGNVYLNMSLLPQAQELFEKSEFLYVKSKNKKDLLLLKLDRIHLLQKKSDYKQAQRQLDKITSYDSITNFNSTVQSKIQLLLGQNYYFLGKIKKAKTHLQKSLNSQQSMSDANPLIIAEINRLLGNVYWRLGDFDKVRVHYQNSFQINKKYLGENHHKTVISLSSLGVLAYSQGQHKHALEIFKTVSEAQLKRLGEQHATTAQTLNYLGATYFELGQFKEAESTLKKALKAYASLDLSHSMKYARTLNNLALIERNFKQFKKAQHTFLRVKAIEIKNLGAKHIEIATLNNNLGLVAADLNQFSQALILFQKSYDLSYFNNQENNVAIAYSMTNIARMYLQLDQPNEAQNWITRALELRKNKLPENNIQFIESLATAASIALAQENKKFAKKSLEKVLAIRTQKLPIGDWRTSETILLLASLSITKNSLFPQETSETLSCHLNNMTTQLGNRHYRLLSTIKHLNKNPQLIQLSHNCILPKSQ